MPGHPGRRRHGSSSSTWASGPRRSTRPSTRACGRDSSYEDPARPRPAPREPSGPRTPIRRPGAPASALRVREARETARDLAPSSTSSSETTRPCTRSPRPVRASWRGRDSASHVTESTPSSTSCSARPAKLAASSRTMARCCTTPSSMASTRTSHGPSSSTPRGASPSNMPTLCVPTALTLPRRAGVGCSASASAPGPERRLSVTRCSVRGHPPAPR